MAAGDPGAAGLPDNAEAKSGIWQSAKRAIANFWSQFDAYIKGASLFGIISALLVAYFQNLSAYESKVATQAKDDLTAATQTFTDVSNALSVPLALQNELIAAYHRAIAANKDSDASAYDTANARVVYKAYTDAHNSLSENYNLLARKLELYIDWPSDRYRDPAANSAPTADRIDMSLLNAYGFDCENHMPSFEKQRKDKDGHVVKDKDGNLIDDSKTVLTDKDTGKTLTIDWYSAKHNALAIETCFDITHRSMTAVRQWASSSPVDDKAKADFVDKNFAVFQTRASNQVLRLNAFMSLAMFNIDKIRVRYRPSGFICSLPGVSEILSLFDSCSAIRTKSPLT
jgi:hypothetical protein